MYMNTPVYAAAVQPSATPHERLVSGNPNASLTPNESVTTQPMTTGLNVEILMDKVPRLGENSTITILLTNENDPWECLAVVNLSDGLRYKSGDLNWSGVLRNQTNFSFVVEAVKEGEWSVTAFLRHPPEGYLFIGDMDSVFITVEEHSSMLRDFPYRFLSGIYIRIVKAVRYALTMLSYR
jgi:hypothetical protein